MGAANVDLIQMAHTTIARSHRNILELHIHVVLRCNSDLSAPFHAVVWSLERFGSGRETDLRGVYRDKPDRR
jgi:hypothetical protein